MKTQIVRCLRFLPLVLAVCSAGWLPMRSKAQGFVWVNQVGRIGNVSRLRTAVDSAGNVYVTGSFIQSANFGVTNLTSVGGSWDIFLAKYDNSGNLLWVKQAGGTGDDFGWDVAVDVSGNAYFTGSFQGTAQFDNTNITAVAPVPIGAPSNLFVAKYNPNGGLVWVKQGGGASGGGGFGIAVDAFGNVYSTGSYAALGTAEVLIDKRDSSGNIVWHQEIPGIQNYNFPIGGNSIKVDLQGNIYVAGQYGTTITLGTNVLTSSFGSDIFVAKLAPDGSYLWAQKAGGDRSAAANALAIDSTGSVFIAGYFDVSASFGNTNLTTRIGDNGDPDAFLAKYDRDGNFLWVDQITGGPGNNSAACVAVDQQGNAFVTGMLTPWQAFISKYDGNGRQLWEIAPGHGSYSGGYGVATDNSGNAYFAAWGTSDMDFDNFAFTNLEGGDIFISKVSEEVGPIIISQPASSPVGFLSGSSFTFAVGVRSVYPVNYQWQFGGTNLAGATDAELTITNAQLVNQGGYRVVVTNAFGAATSAIANLNVYFTITTAINGTGYVSTTPSASSFLANSLVTLTAGTNFGFAFTDWSGDVSGTNNPVTVVITTNLYVMASFADAITNIVIDDTDPRAQFSGAWQSGTAYGMYGTDYRYAICSPSNSASVIYRPSIVVPGYYDVSVSVPWASNFSTNAPWVVTYSGGSIVTNFNEMSWYPRWTPIASGLYFDAGTNGFVSLSNVTGESSNTLVVADAVRFFPSVPPRITWDPQSQRVKAGGSAIFNVYATGTTPLAYQWRVNGANVAGGSASSLTLPQIQANMAGNYSVVVSNLMGTAVSKNAVLTVAPPSAPLLLNGASASNGQVQLSLMGDPGVIFIIQTSSNLVDWTDLTNLLNASGTTSLTDMIPPNIQSRFYRAKWSSQ